MADEPHRIVSSEFGNLLRRYRLAAGLSQEELAERARMSPHGISALERGYRRNPQRETVALLAGALKLSNDQLEEFEAAPRSEAPRHIGRTQGRASARHDSATSNLPCSLTSFVGRDRDLAEIKNLLKIHRLLTLTGSGGVGKTRLAIQVGADLLDRYPDGVWFVDLAPITDPELVASVAAQALGMSQQQGRRVEESILLWLKRKKLLLIMDNCEHVLDTAARLADSVLRAAQGVCVLATSRQRLGISGETVYRVPSLAVPVDATHLMVQEALGYGGIQLFVDRATAADTRFTLTDDNVPLVAEVCRRLDGIALAVELAAARVTVLPIPALAAELNRRFEILSQGSRSALPRRRTLSALIGWSYDLLSPQEQLLFSRLGIFAGGFGLDAASAVCGGGVLDQLEIFDLLTSLADKSLVVADTSGDTERFRLLESMAAYALEKLQRLGQHERMARAHAEYFRDHADNAGKPSGARTAIAWRIGVEPELDNYRTALEWALTRGNDAVLGGAIAGALGRLWWNAGLSAEGRYWIELSLDRVSEAEEPAITGRMQLALAGLFSGSIRSYEAAEHAIRLYESVGDLRGTALARRHRGLFLLQTGQLDDAREAIEQALAGARACGDKTNMASCLHTLADEAWIRGDFHMARELFARALRAWKDLGDELGVAAVLTDLAELEFATGEPAQALRSANEALEFASLQKNLPDAAIWHANTTAYHIALSDLAGARESACMGLRIAQRVRYEPALAWILQHLALIAALDGNTRCGAQLLGYVNVQYDLLGMKRENTERWSYDKLLTTLRESLSDDEIQMLAAGGAVWTEDRAIEEALNLVTRGEVRSNG